MHVPPTSDSPNFNADLEYLFSGDQNGDVLNSSSPGVCGLCNLGNTCFMNSGLQCLLNTPTMVQFFMKQVSEDTANPDSLATHFMNLFQKVWSGKYSKVKPTDFHQALGSHHSQFKDYRQHDCQEFLALVLGSLHELLNTASSATSMNSPINMDDDLEADKQWEKHLGHNQSVIVDSFQGQFKSTVVCSECRYVSSTYEPFMYLSVPLPHAMEQQICVTFVPANSNPPTKFLLTLNKQDKIIKIKEHLRKLMKVNVTMSLELAEVLHHHIARILDENLYIRYLGTSDPYRSIYAFEIPDDVNATVSSSLSKGDSASLHRSEPLDLTPEQYPVSHALELGSKTVKLNNVETRKMIKQSESDTTKSNISSTINNNLKEESDLLSSNGRTSIESSPFIGPVFYGPHLEDQGGGDAWVTEKCRPVDLTSSDKDDWKSCAICLEEVEKGLKNHKGCSCFLCDSCIERSVKHYNEGEENGLMKCPVCNDLVDPEKAFELVDGNVDFKSSVRMLKIPVLFRLDIEGDGGSSSSEKCQKLFGHPHLIKVPNRLKGSELYEIVGKLIPYSNFYSIAFVDGQGYHCSRCMYTARCKGCKVSEDAEINLQTGDNLAVLFTSLVVEIPAIEHHSLKEFRSQEQLSIYDCLDAFSESETLDEHNPWYCPTCQRNQCATKTLSVWRYPDFLIVYLKRFVFHEYTSVKLDDKVSFPLTGLNLVPPSRIQQGTIRPYNLYACVNHFGGASAGHYTAYAKNPQSGDWHLFNDETVTAQKPQEDDFCNAYVLFYQKQGTTLSNLSAFVREKCYLMAPQTLQILSSLKIHSSEVKIQKINSLLRKYFLRLRSRDPSIQYSSYYRV
ncbi:predicted protein [Pediculus humanus corporis]|uniref:ubiquitinyl hydrolase 1 n=1 Tax=Pediculus humanus subsp. corporis TaxID=121224 RepID=E0VE65_PEDHC|nr:uncharacterized protein Phum_PHUM128640 [Pediculus humanus corporis]EEB11671.1 predicted protein [Pediculus humanus corporis]